jgi:hypothetical protein
VSDGVLYAPIQIGHIEADARSWIGAGLNQEGQSHRVVEEGGVERPKAFHHQAQRTVLGRHGRTVAARALGGEVADPLAEVLGGGGGLGGEEEEEENN